MCSYMDICLLQVTNTLVCVNAKLLVIHHSFKQKKRVKSANAVSSMLLHNSVYFSSLLLVDYHSLVQMHYYLTLSDQE
jgi:hypothetical protein